MTDVSDKKSKGVLLTRRKYVTHWSVRYLSKCAYVRKPLLIALSVQNGMLLLTLKVYSVKCGCYYVCHGKI
jgi:hypothetical protein